MIKQKINELKKNSYEIKVFQNKINVFTRLKNYKNCSVCLSEDVLNIILNCGHEICIECYEPNMKCYYYNNFCK